MIKNICFAAIIIACVIAVPLWLVSLSGPRTYDDCVLANVDKAATSQAGYLIAKACRDKFPEPIDTDNPLAKYYGK
jgi:hypothetical protein